MRGLLLARLGLPVSGRLFCIRLIRLLAVLHTFLIITGHRGRRGRLDAVITGRRGEEGEVRHVTGGRDDTNTTSAH